jgi:hypothetical protein
MYLEAFFVDDSWHKAAELLSFLKKEKIRLKVFRFYA